MRQGLLGIVVAMTALGLGRAAVASGASEIEAARAARQVVFLVVTDATARGVDVSLAAARGAQQAVPGSVVVLLDRGSPENAAPVREMRLGSAPVPLVLVIAANGVVAGGTLPNQTTAETLVRLVPTPAKADLLLHLSQNRPCVVVFSRPTMPLRQPVFEACVQAHALLEGRLGSVMVEVDAAGEKAFLAEHGIDPKSDIPTTIVFGAKGNKADVYRGAVTPAQIVESTKKSAPCCPGGKC